MDQTSLETLRVTRWPGGLAVSIDRPARQNALNDVVLAELQHVFASADADPEMRVVVLEGGEPEKGARVFCSGLDFADLVAAAERGAVTQPEPMVRAYADLLKRFTLAPYLVVSLVEGPASAGGLGLIAASDFVVATHAARFSLPEAIWGLLPANVAPYLIRRIGFQRAYAMALLTGSLDAETAWRTGLVDELTDNTDAALRRLELRVSRLTQSTIAETKRFFRELWIVNEATEREARETILRRLADRDTIAAIGRFVKDGRFPWQ